MWNIGAVDRIDETEAIEMSQPKPRENSRKDKYFIGKWNWGTCGRIRLCWKSRRLMTLMAHKTSERVFWTENSTLCIEFPPIISERESSNN